MIQAAIKALFGSIVSGLTSLVNRWRQDSSHVERGGLEAGKGIQDDAIDKLKKYREIDADDRSLDDAVAGLREPKAGPDDE